MALTIDHVVIPVADLDRGADDVERKTGLSSVPGGRHGGHGTANHIVPLGDAYLELVAVVDPVEASHSPFGSWVMARAATGKPAVLCLRTSSIEDVARRLDLQPLAMERRRPDGVVLSWRIAGLEAALTRSLPFFIQWEVPPDFHPGQARVQRRVALDVTLSGDPDTLTDWIGGAVPRLTLVTGPPGMAATVTVDGAPLRL